MTDRRNFLKNIIGLVAIGSVAKADIPSYIEGGIVEAPKHIFQSSQYEGKLIEAARRHLRNKVTVKRMTLVEIDENQIILPSE